MLIFIYYEEIGICVEVECVFLKKLNGGCEILIVGFVIRVNEVVYFKGLVGNVDGFIIFVFE